MVNSDSLHGSYFKDKEYSIALELINLALAFREDFRFYHLRGKVYSGMSKFEEAVKDFGNAIDIIERRRKDGNRRAEDFKRELAYVHHDLARAYMALTGEKNMQTAIKHYDKAIKLYPTKTGWYLECASAMIKYGTHDDALKLLRKVSKTEPQNPYVYIRMGDAYGRKGLFDRALDYYNRAIKIDPLNKEAYDKKEDVLLAKMLNMSVKDLEAKMYM